MTGPIPAEPPADAPARPTIRVVVVHYRSGGMLGDLVGQLFKQVGVEIDLHLVECGDDGSVAAALDEHAFAVEDPGENLGYSGGNNLVLREWVHSEAPLCIVNPDVDLTDPFTLLYLAEALGSYADFAAIAPAIRTAEDRIEYTQSEIDLPHATVIHTHTHVLDWPPTAPPLVTMPWIDGACWMLRPAALRQVGLFDERFFLFSEEADWCLRARQLGWQVGVLRQVEIGHQRSSSFGVSSKGAYYAWRNTFLMCQKHEGYGTWMVFWLRRLIRFASNRANRDSGQSRAALRGARDALVGRSGRMPGDA